MIHRDYAVGAPIQIRVYDDRLQIWNAGELPEDWTTEKLLQPHSSKPYNPIIANAFFRAGQIEAWGRGIQKIMDACKEAGTPMPKVTCDCRDMVIEFPFSPEYLKVLYATLGDSTEETTQKAAQKTSVETGNKTANKTGNKASVKASVKTSVKIIDAISKNSQITIPELAEMIRVTGRSIERNIHKMQENGVVCRIGPDKGGYWEVVDNGELKPQKTSAENPLRLGNGLGNRLGNQLGNAGVRILDEIRNNPKVSARKLAAILEISTTAVEKNIKQMREAGILRRVGGTRGHWEAGESG